MDVLESLAAVAGAFFATCGLPLLAVALAVVIWSWIHASSSKDRSVVRGPADAIAEPQVPARASRVMLDREPPGGR